MEYSDRDSMEFFRDIALNDENTDSIIALLKYTEVQKYDVREVMLKNKGTLLLSDFESNGRFAIIADDDLALSCFNALVGSTIVNRQ